MKTKFILLIYLFLVVLVSCDNEPSAKEVFIKDISKKWKPSPNGVMFKGQQVNGVFNTFTVTFAKGLTYSTTDGQDPVWKASGKFTVEKATNAVGFSIVRDDGVIITVDELTDTKLILKFDFTAGRLNSVSGGYVFELVPE
jgi:hypothetical protein